MFTAMVFLDLKRRLLKLITFLLKKLSKYSISANALDWFNNYLLDGKQHVKVNLVFAKLYVVSHRELYWVHNYLSFTLVI